MIYLKYLVELNTCYDNENCIFQQKIILDTGVLQKFLKSMTQHLRALKPSQSQLLMTSCGSESFYTLFLLHNCIAFIMVIGRILFEYLQKSFCR